MKLKVGDYVERSGDDVHRVVQIDDDGLCGEFLCVVAPESGWCKVGDVEHNLTSRYSLVEYKPPNAAVTQ